MDNTEYRNKENADLFEIKAISDTELFYYLAVLKFGENNR